MQQKIILVLNAENLDTSKTLSNKKKINQLKFDREIIFLKLNFC